MPASLSPQEALIYAMVATSAVDRSMSDQELSRIGSIVSELPMFETFDAAGDLIGVSQDCGKVLAGKNGLNVMLNMIGNTLSADLRETAYMLALEVAAVDLSVNAEETRFLELLARALDLDRLIVAALERGARARHQRVR